MAQLSLEVASAPEEAPLIYQNCVFVTIILKMKLYYYLKKKDLKPPFENINGAYETFFLFDFDVSLSKVKQLWAGHICDVIALDQSGVNSYRDVMYYCSVYIYIV